MSVKDEKKDVESVDVFDGYLKGKEAIEKGTGEFAGLDDAGKEKALKTLKTLAKNELLKDVAKEAKSELPGWISKENFKKALAENTEKVEKETTEKFNAERTEENDGGGQSMIDILRNKE